MYSLRTLQAPPPPTRVSWVQSEILRLAYQDPGRKNKTKRWVWEGPPRHTQGRGQGAVTETAGTRCPLVEESGKEAGPEKPSLQHPAHRAEREAV